MSTPKLEMRRAEFARHIGVDRAYITRLANAGRLVLTDDGKKIRVEESMARLGDTADPSKDGVRERHAETRGSTVLPLLEDLGASNASGGGGEEAPGRASMTEARRQLIEAQVVRERLRSEKEAGNLVDAEQVRRATFDKARVARNALFGMVDVLASRLAAETNAAKVHEILSAEIRRVCEELAAGEAAQTRQ